MTTPERPDRDLEDLLDREGGRIGRLYRRLPHYEPPRRLDRAVLGEAARAVHSGKPPRRQRWLVGVGSAAGVVLAAGIAWRIGHDALNPPTGGQTQAPAAAERVVPVQPIDDAERARHPPPPAAAAPSGVPESSAEAPQPTRTIRHRAARSALESPAPPPPAPAEEKIEASRPTAPAKPKTSAPDAFPPPSTSGRADSSAFSGQLDQAARQQESGAGLASPNEPSPMAVAPTSSVELRRDMQLAPDEWLARIRSLSQQGRRQQATESLQLFHSRYPDRPIPGDLAPLLH